MADFLIFINGLTLGDTLGLGKGFLAILFNLVAIPFLCLIESPIFLYAALKGELPSLVIASEHLEMKIMLYSMFWSGLLWYALSNLVTVQRPYPISSFVTRMALNYSVAGMVLLTLLSEIKGSLQPIVLVFSELTLPEPPHIGFVLVWALLAGFMSWGRAYIAYDGVIPFTKVR